MIQVDLHDFDMIVLNSSAGKDSQAMIDHMVKMAYKQTYDLMNLVVVHADLGRVEWSGTRELAEKQAQAYGLRFIAISRPQGDLLQQVEERGKWPSSTCRYCTSDQKRDQVSKVITALSREVVAVKGKGHHVNILNCLGLRAEESPARAKREEMSINKRLSNKSRTVMEYLPIHGWLEGKVWDTIKASGVPHHPAYDLGMRRLSCVFCIFAPKAALRIAGKHNPALLADYVALEKKIDHTFRQGFAIKEIADEIATGVTEDEDLDGAWNM